MTEFYSPDIYDLDEASLNHLHLHRDDLGRVRTETGEMVCEVSGRTHSVYLIAVPRYLGQGRWDVMYIDRQAAQEAGIGAAARGARGLAQWLIGRLGRVLLEVIR